MIPVPERVREALAGREEWQGFYGLERNAAARASWKGMIRAEPEVAGRFSA